MCTLGQARAGGVHLSARVLGICPRRLIYGEGGSVGDAEDKRPSMSELHFISGGFLASVPSKPDPLSPRLIKEPFN